MKFIKVPTKLTLGQELEESKLTDKEPESYNGFSIINLDELEFICGDEEVCTVYFKSGGSLDILLTLDEINLLIGGK